jgi:ribonuclease P protein component
MPEFSFKKGERLSSGKAITSLFQSGSMLVSHPVRILYHASGEEGDYTARMAVSVPKRLFKRAVDRNLLKRRIREAYRQMKPEFYRRLKQKGVKVQMVIQYQHAEIVDYKVLEAGIRKGLEKMEGNLSE